MIKNLPGRLLILILLLASCEIGDTSEKQKLTGGFDISDYCDDLEREEKVYRVKVVYSDSKLSDTITKPTYRLDTLLDLLRTYNITQKGQEGFYEYQTIQRDLWRCDQFHTDNDKLAVRKLEVCFKEDQLMSIRAQKVQKTLINSMRQALEFKPEERFSVHTQLINRWKKDTVINSTEIFLSTK